MLEKRKGTGCSCYNCCHAQNTVKWGFSFTRGALWGPTSPSSPLFWISSWDLKFLGWNRHLECCLFWFSCTDRRVNHWTMWHQSCFRFSCFDSASQDSWKAKDMRNLMDPMFQKGKLCSMLMRRTPAASCRSWITKTTDGVTIMQDGSVDSICHQSPVIWVWFLELSDKPECSSAWFYSECRYGWDGKPR